MTADDLLFSVVVPTYNRPRELARCLEALASLDYPHRRYEVIVVDDGSTSPIEPLVARVAEQVDLRLIRQDNAGPAAARNSGAEVARGRYLAFTDDDCRPPPGWLRTLQAHAEREPEAMIGGPTASLIAEDLYAATSQAILEMVYGFFNPPAQEARFLASNNMVLPARGFAALGGFDARYRWPEVGSEDRDICDRWLHQGGEIRFVPEARVGHAHPMSFANFCRQHFGYGRGAWIYHRQRSKRRSGKMAQDLRFHLELPRLLASVLRPLGPRERLAVATLLGLWQVVNASGFFYQMALGSGTPGNNNMVE